MLDSECLVDMTGTALLHSLRQEKFGPSTAKGMMIMLM
jgi:hypothetical protein